MANRIWRALTSPTARSVRQNVWAFLNSAVVIAVITGIFVASITRSWSARDEEERDFDARSSRLDSALTELQQRSSYLQAADSAWTERCRYPEASKLEWDAITGTGSYVATAPVYRGMNIEVVLTEADRASGAWDPGYISSRWLGFFTVRPPRTALFVRGQIEWLESYVSKRMFASSLGHLPLRRGQKLTSELETELGIPTLEETHREALAAHDRLQRALREVRPNVPPCKE